MANRTASLLPSTQALLQQFGERLMLARRRRRLSAKQVADRAGMSPITLRRLERGSPGVTLGAYASVMQVLGIETEFALLGKADSTGRDLQDASIMPGASKRVRPVRSPAATLNSPSSAQLAPSPAPEPSGVVARRSGGSKKSASPPLTEASSHSGLDTERSKGFVDPLQLLRLIDVPNEPAPSTRKTKS